MQHRLLVCRLRVKIALTVWQQAAVRPLRTGRDPVTFLDFRSIGIATIELEFRMMRLESPAGMGRQRAIGYRQLWVVLAVLVSVWFVGMTGVAAADVPAVFSPAPLDGGQPYFSIALPPDWQMAADGRDSSQSASQRVVLFTFTPADAESPYVFVKVENCGGNESRKRKANAVLVEQRAFLSGGEAGTQYFDAKRQILWQRGKNDRSPHIAATFFGRNVVEFRFFHQAGHLGAWTPTVKTIVSHVHVYQVGEIATEYTVDTGLFTPTIKSGWFRSLMWSIPFLIVVLVAVERLISCRRHRAEMAEIDAEIEERKKQSREPASLVNAAGEYQQQVQAARRQRVRGSTSGPLT